MNRTEFESWTREKQIWETWDRQRRPLYRGVAFMCPVLKDEAKQPLLIDDEPYIRIELDDDLVVRFRRREDDRGTGDIGRHKGTILEEIELERDFILTPTPRADGKEPIELQRLDTNPGFNAWLAERRQAAEG